MAVQMGHRVGHAVVQRRRRGESLVVGVEEARQRLVRVGRDAGPGQRPSDERAGALADHRDDVGHRQGRGVVAGEHRVGGVSEILARIDQRAVEVKDEVSVEHTSTLHVERVAVLCSGGLDSVVLAADLATTAQVYPIYVASGLAWEREERAMLERALQAFPGGAHLAPLHVLDATVRDVYAPTHWSLTGNPPAWDTPDEEVYLAGRNIVLLGKAAVYCALRQIGRVALGPLAGNPFPDATPEFFEAMARALSLGLAHPITIETPYRAFAQGRRDPPRPRHRRTDGADDVLHESGQRLALRRLQQVPGAARRLRRRDRRRSDAVRRDEPPVSVAPYVGVDLPVDAREIASARCSGRTLSGRQPSLTVGQSPTATLRFGSSGRSWRSGGRRACSCA